MTEKAVVPHPGRFNDSWTWLCTVADAMRKVKDTSFPSMLHRGEIAYLNGGVDECIAVVREYVEIEEIKND